MLARSAFAILLVLASLSGPAQAQGTEPTATEWTITDPAGDASGLAGAAVGHVDIVAATASVDDVGLAFRVQVAALESDAASFGNGYDLWLRFLYRDTLFDLAIEPKTSTVPEPKETTLLFSAAAAHLYRVSDSKRLAELSFGLDVASRTFNTSVPWSVIDSGGFTPAPGEGLQFVEAAAVPYVSFVAGRYDPTTASAVVPYDVAPFQADALALVPGAVGDLRLGVRHGLRFSNGEATTFHWAVDVTNLAEGARDVHLAIDAAGLPARVPDLVRLEGGATRTVNAYVTVPFAHEHGVTRTFPLKASMEHGDQAILRLGVHYPYIAQPAGHHPDLYLQVAGNSEAGGQSFIPRNWMNTRPPEHLPSGLVAGPGPQVGCGDFQYGVPWVFPLEPALAIGLNARLGEAGQLDVMLHSDVPFLPGRLLAGLTLADPEAFGDIAIDLEGDDVGEAAVGAGPPGDLAVSVPVPIPKALDHAPPGSGNLRLVVVYCHDGDYATGGAMIGYTGAHGMVGIHRPLMGILPGGHLRLPLDEYHDAIPLSLEGAGIDLRLDDAVAYAAPGATVLWRPTLVDTQGGGTFALDLFGAAASQARLLSPIRVDVNDDPREVPVVLEVPSDARPGDVLDLVLEVHAVKDPLRVASLRLAVVVDPDSKRDDAADVAALAGAVKDSPGAPWATAALALLALAVATRRRRQ